MSNILVLTTDLPFFPGKNGHDFFNLRYLARKHHVAVVGPIYSRYPEAGLSNLRQSVSSITGWPTPIVQPAPFISEPASLGLTEWVRQLKPTPRRLAMRALLGILNGPKNAYLHLAILANSASHLLQQLHERNWDGIILIQSSAAPWLDYLPKHPALFVYFHDVQSDYIKRIVPPLPKKEIAAMLAAEKQLAREADVIGFVSDLDRQRAYQLLQPKALTGVGPIPVDTDYFTPRPDSPPPPASPTVLFTGHLSHPPNVDAVIYFIEEIWPHVKKSVPTARFVVAGQLPAEVLSLAISKADGAELHANVPDIRPYFWNAHAYVVPMRFGGGVRQKIFEAWSMRLPVISTSMAMEGITISNGKEAWLEDEPVKFAAKVSEVLNGTIASDTVIHARRYVDSNHSISAAAPKFADLVSFAITTRRKKPFRLLLDARWMEIGKAGGVEQMTHELFSAISHLDRKNEYRILAPRSSYYEWDFPKEFKCRPVYSDASSSKWEAAFASITNRLSEGIGRQPILTPAMRTLRAFRKMDFDLVHSTGGYSNPDLRVCPGILTMLDLQHLHYPEFFGPEEWRERDNLYRESLNHAKHVICISEHTRQDIHKSYGIPLEKMTTIWIIPSRGVWTPLSESRERDLLAKMSVTGPFLFFPAHPWPHKNHARLIEAFAAIRGSIPANWKLLFTGKPFPENHPAQIAIRKGGLESCVKHLGYRSPIEIRALFQASAGLVFPSLFEGFGMPVAEAIIAGRPVACSNSTCLPEIGGDAAVYFDPTNVNDIAASLLELIQNTNLRSHLADRATQRRMIFSSREIAVKTLAVYQQVHSEAYS
jgi:glycosyltransferase involved in cell wall biosynthesis